MIQGLIPLSVFIASLIAGSTGDALDDKLDSRFGHALKATEIGILVMSPFIVNVDPNFWDILVYGGAYTALRIALFDVLYNVFHGNPINYSGKKSWWDRIMSRVPGHGKWWIRAWHLVLGTSLLLVGI